MRAASVNTLNADGSTTETVIRAAPIHVERFDATICSKPTILSAALTRMQKTLSDLGLLVSANPIAQSILFRNVACPASGKVVLQHNLGHIAQWMVVGWRGPSTTSPPTLVDDRLDTSSVLTTQNTLALHSYAVGQADIMVF